MATLYLCNRSELH